MAKDDCFYIYRIRHRDTGLYSKGGWYTREGEGKGHYWHKRGKVWSSAGVFKSHLAYYKRPTSVWDPITKNYTRVIQDIPEEWIVIEYNLDEGSKREMSAREFYEKTKRK